MQDGAMKVGGEILDRMAELKSFFNDISKNATDRETYNHEFHELQKELNSLRAQKFNGVSLFAMTEPDNNPLKIITSDDGLGEKIELSRTGLFENLKSKFGADGVLNSGSHGEYRQLVGDFTVDGGITDAIPGKTSRDYTAGQVVFKNGATEAESGYFMALTDVKGGIDITDSYGANSSWIRISDKSGKGFAESYPTASVFDPYSTKFASDGEQVSYLKGDIVKVAAHWSSPGSYLYLEAKSDVPANMSLEALFNGNHVGPNGFFDYVGQERSNGVTTSGKPTTEYIRANSNLPEPSFYSALNSTALANLMNSHTTDGYTPGYVRDPNGDIYKAAHNWDIKKWDSSLSYKEGELVLDETTNPAAPTINEFLSTVKGTYNGGSYAPGEFVNSKGTWFTVGSQVNVTGDTPHDPANTTVMQDGATTAQGSYTNIETGQAIKNTAGEILVGTSRMKGDFNVDANYSTGDMVFQNGSYIEMPTINATQGLPQDWDVTQAYAVGNVVRHNGDFYLGLNANAIGGQLPSQDPTNWLKVGSNIVALDAAITANSGLAGFTSTYPSGYTVNDFHTAGHITASEALIDAELVPGNAAAAGTYFTKSNFQVVDNTGANIGTPTTANGGMIAKTSEYQDVTNSKHWSKTHFGKLTASSTQSWGTMNSNYERGDNIVYQGRHYVYTSHLPSNDPTFVSPSNDGFTEFEDLLRNGAVTELSMYVDTIGGGGSSNLPDGVFYRPNQSLNYIDRLPNTGTVRTNSVERRAEASNDPAKADLIHNSRDDQFYGGLNAGNDGIYGTMDDFYASTAHTDVAMAGAHIDADADNNKDLLNTANGLQDFSVADFVDYIQTLANVRAVNGGTMSRLGYAERMLEENQINLGAATSRIMDADMAAEATKMAQQNVLVQAGAAMVSQANAQSSLVLSLLQ
jgi:flagellin-like hook-associated protein FlgL